MTTLDNLMAGRILKMRRGLLWHALYWGPAQREEIHHRQIVEEIIDFLRIEHIRKTPVGKLPYGLRKRVELGRALRFVVPAIASGAHAAVGLDDKSQFASTAQLRVP